MNLPISLILNCVGKQASSFGKQSNDHDIKIKIYLNVKNFILKFRKINLKALNRDPWGESISLISGVYALRKSINKKFKFLFKHEQLRSSN